MTDPKLTPPPELVQQWAKSSPAVFKYVNWDYELHIATKSAQWGADQQLAKDAEWLDHNALNEPHLRITPVGESLKEAMRPKPPSLKEQALDELVAAERLYPADWSTIRRALEQLND